MELPNSSIQSSIKVYVLIANYYNQSYRFQLAHKRIDTKNLIINNNFYYYIPVDNFNIIQFVIDGMENFTINEKELNITKTNEYISNLISVSSTKIKETDNRIIKTFIKYYDNLNSTEWFNLNSTSLISFKINNNVYYMNVYQNNSFPKVVYNEETFIIEEIKDNMLIRLDHRYDNTKIINDKLLVLPNENDYLSYLDITESLLINFDLEKRSILRKDIQIIIHTMEYRKQNDHIKIGSVIVKHKWLINNKYYFILDVNRYNLISIIMEGLEQISITFFDKYLKKTKKYLNIYNSNETTIDMINYMFNEIEKTNYKYSEYFNITNRVLISFIRYGMEYEIYLIPLFDINKFNINFSIEMPMKVKEPPYIIYKVVTEDDNKKIIKRIKEDTRLTNIIENKPISPLNEQIKKNVLLLEIISNEKSWLFLWNINSILYIDFKKYDISNKTIITMYYYEIDYVINFTDTFNIIYKQQLNENEKLLYSLFISNDTSLVYKYTTEINTTTNYQKFMFNIKTLSFMNYFIYIVDYNNETFFPINRTILETEIVNELLTTMELTPKFNSPNLIIIKSSKFMYPVEIIDKSIINLANFKDYYNNNDYEYIQITAKNLNLVINFSSLELFTRIKIEDSKKIDYFYYNRNLNANDLYNINVVVNFDKNQVLLIMIDSCFYILTLDWSKKYSDFMNIYFQKEASDNQLYDKFKSYDNLKSKLSQKKNQLERFNPIEYIYISEKEKKEYQEKLSIDIEELEKEILLIEELILLIKPKIESLKKEKNNEKEEYKKAMIHFEQSKILANIVKEKFKEQKINIKDY